MAQDTSMNRTFSQIRPVREIQPFGISNISYTPKQIGQAYNIKSVPTLSGKKKVVITIVVAYRYTKLQSDLNKFCSNFNIYPTGSKNPPILEIFNMSSSSMATGTVGWQTEACIDVQLAYAMNPNAHIRVIQAKSDSNNDLYPAIAFANSITKNTSTRSANYSSFGTTDIVSLSWGMEENKKETELDSCFRNSSICYLAASGDYNYAAFPSVCPNVLSCGGTSLTSIIGTRTETTWPSAGCGISTVYLKPTYQSGLDTLIKVDKRCVPDISAIANVNTGTYFIYNNIPYIAGGTSVSTPICAGILSLGIQNRHNSGKPAITTFTDKTNNSNLQTFLYKNLYTSKDAYRNCFYDITSGIDGSFNATIFYDIATGLGSLNASNFIDALLQL